MKKKILVKELRERFKTIAPDIEKSWNDEMILNDYRYCPVCKKQCIDYQELFQMIADSSDVRDFLDRRHDRLHAQCAEIIDEEECLNEKIQAVLDQIKIDEPTAILVDEEFYEDIISCKYIIVDKEQLLTGGRFDVDYGFCNNSKKKMQSAFDIATQQMIEDCKKNGVKIIYSNNEDMPRSNDIVNCNNHLN